MGGRQTFSDAAGWDLIGLLGQLSSGDATVDAGRGCAAGRDVSAFNGTDSSYFTVVSPEFAPPDGNQVGFNGDYSGLVINKEDEAHPIWSDTRNVNPFPLNGSTHDEDVFTMSVELP